MLHIEALSSYRGFAARCDARLASPLRRYYHLGYAPGYEDRRRSCLEAIVYGRDSGNVF